jgi:hypothetical protein
VATKRCPGCDTPRNLDHIILGYRLSIIYSWRNNFEVSLGTCDREKTLEK